MSINRLPILRHGQTSWDKTLLPELEFKRRIELLRQAMRERSLGALIIYSDMIHSGRLAYVINFHVFDPRMPGLVLITPSALDAVLKVTGRDLPFISNFTQARLYNADFLSGDLSIKLGELVGEYGLLGKRIGLVGASYMPSDLLKKTQERVGADNIENCDQMLARIQRNKSEAERGLMRAAAGKAEAVLAQIVEHALPGATESSLAAYADYAARMNGCQDIEVLVYSSDQLGKGVWPRDHLPFRPASAKRMAEGDGIGLYLALQIQGYWVELSQTIYIGVPTQKQAEAYQKAVARYEELLRSLRPSGNYGSEQWNDDATSVWLHGTGTDRDESPSPSGEGAQLADGDLLCAHIAVKSAEGVVFIGRQIAVAEAGTHTLFSSASGLELKASSSSAQNSAAQSESSPTHARMVR